ncbi:MBL fold metallo-hydrolase [Sanyastnella coralliicola]|uniref:MBL fold metallo-hydrolase n=1 Tax=Sanyastnella coralliicola TaxID=3069118 RepID=UPI0027BAEEC0|nr:MBL fold metallo-hydrolase [Longitalea sp. SCSIO 12813]
MKLEQIYTGCLAQGAYYIESDGEAAIIDPLRETQPYMEKAADRGAQIKYIFETHFHADFVSGHVDLAQKTGAKIVYGPNATTEYDKHEATDGEEFELGKLTIKVLHTPGHTMESSCYLLLDENKEPHALFSGDTLFIGDVGRPDLAQGATGMTTEDLAGTLFDSLRNKIMPLPDNVLVYPAHGAGSACGKNMSSQTWDTLGNQKATNYALRADMTRDEFIAEVTDGILPPPGYFAANVKMNKAGYQSIDKVLERGKVALDADTFEAIANHEGALVLDTRSEHEFVEAHVPNSVFIGIDGNFAPWVGAMIPDLSQPIVFLAEEGREEEVVTRLSRVGYDNTLGYLKGGVQAWKDAGKDTEVIPTVSAQDLADKINAGETHVLDVRKKSEFEAEHIDGARNLPLDYINDNFKEVDPEQELYVHCAGGYRSVIYASILKARGYHKLINVAGGFKAIAETDISTSEFVCPNSGK